MLRQVLFGENMVDLYSKLFLIALIIVSVLVINGTVASADEFKSHLKLISHDKVGPEDEEKFLKADKNYLSNTKKKENDINDEITQLEAELEAVKNDYITTKNNIKIYTGNTGLKNNALRTAIVNRRNFVRSGGSFKYDDRTKYMIDRDYDKEARGGKNFNQKDLDIALESTKEVVENLELDTEFLKGTTFVVSPYKIEGVNGYTVTRSHGQHTIVISKQVLMAPENFSRRTIKSTTLHEIGHVLYNNKNIAKFNTGLVSKYSVSNSISQGSTNLSQWKESPTENFAEDFKIFSASKLGAASFEPTKKQTSQPYDENGFLKLMEAIY